MTQAVAKRSAASQRMLESAATGRALMGGTRAMRAAGMRYLPKFAAEGREAYDARLKSSWLYNGYRKTVRDMTGRIFAKPVELGEDTPDELRAYAENIDNAGNDLSQFARQVTLDGMQAGISYIMVDAPPREGTVTQAQAAQSGLRPYFVHLRAEDVLGWRTETVNNATTLVQLRIAETVLMQDPDDEFGQVEVEQVRVLDREAGGVRTRLYQRESRGDKWQVVPDGETFAEIPEITVVPVYFARAAFFEGEPPLDDLADVNVAHWQSQSDQRNILHFARVPILVRTGVDPEAGAAVVGAATSMDMSDPNARVAWVEHSGQAIGAGRQDLKDLEFQMETFGLQLLAQNGQQSATGEVLDAAKETSQLAMMADALRDGLERAFQFMAMYAGLGDVSPEVTVNDEFGASMMNAQEATVLLTAVNAGQMSRHTFLREMSRRGMLAADTDPEDEAERIASEGGAPADMQGSPLDLNG